MLRRAPALVLLLLALATSAQRYGVGSTIAPRSLEDQHGARADLDESVRLLVVTRDMEAGDLVKKALAGVEQKVLDGRDAIYVADISRMPALVSRLFAVPRMRERAYRVLLDRDGSLARELPHVDGKPAVVTLAALRITAVAHPGTVEEVRAAVLGRDGAEG
jgi:hypothetical protein